MISTLNELKDVLREFAKELALALNNAENGMRNDDEVQVYTGLESAKLASQKLENRLK